MDHGYDENLRDRVIAAISADEEFLEEIFLSVNFTVEERRDIRPLLFQYTAFEKTFRLEEILRILIVLEQQGTIGWRVPSGSPIVLGPVGYLYSLTDQGRQYWESSVSKRLDDLFS